MTTQKIIDGLRTALRHHQTKWYAPSGCRDEHSDLLSAAIAALEAQAAAEQSKRLAPFPWRRGQTTGFVVDADGWKVLVAANNSEHKANDVEREEEIIAHILAHSQGEPESPEDNAKRIARELVNGDRPITGTVPVQRSVHLAAGPAVDPAAVRCEESFLRSSGIPISEYISRSLNLPQLRRLATELARMSAIPQGQRYGLQILACLDGQTKGD